MALRGGIRSISRPKVRYRVGPFARIALLAIAVTCDLFQFLFKFLWFTVILSILAEALGWMFAGFCLALCLAIFWACGVPVFGGRMAGRSVARFAFMLVIEMAPVINMMPSMTFWVWGTIADSRKQDIANARKKAEEKARKNARENARLKQILLRRQYAREAVAGSMLAQSARAREEATEKLRRERLAPGRNYADFALPPDATTPRVAAQDNVVEQPFRRDVRTQPRTPANDNTPRPYHKDDQKAA